LVVSLQPFLLALADALPPSSCWLVIALGGCLAALVVLVGWMLCHLC
jgi:hypothetical protein